MIKRFFEEIGGNRVVMALSFARLGDAVGNSILFVVVPLYIAKLPSPWFPVPETVRVGVLISLFGLVNTLMQPFMGAWSDHVNRRKIFIQGGLLLMGLASLAFIFASRYVDMVILRVIQGIGVALTVPAAVAILAVSSHQQSRGGSMGIYTAFRMGGLAIGPLIGGLLFDRFGFVTTFITGSMFIFAGVVMVQIWVKEVRVETKKDHEQKSFQLFEKGLLSPGILGAGFASFVMAGAFTMLTTLEKQFNVRLDQTAFGFGLAFSAFTFSRLIFQIPLGRWSDTLGRKPLIIGGLLLLAPATVWLAYTTSTMQLASARVVQGIASAGVAAPAFAVAADLARKGGEGRQMSIITMGFGLGIATGPLVAGILAIYSFTLPFWIMGGLCLVAAWVVFQFVPETIKRNPPPSRPDEDASEAEHSFVVETDWAVPDEDNRAG